MAITAADFINKYKLTTTDFNETQLDAYVTRYSEITLIELFGKELYDLWVTGIGGSDPIYEFLRDPFTEQLDCGLILNSRGTDDILLGVVYFYWSRDIMTQQTSNGPVEKAGENSTIASSYRANIQSRWDEAVNSYQAIQKYICDNSDVYPTFKGLPKTFLNIF